VGVSTTKAALPSGQNATVLGADLGSRISLPVVSTTAEVAAVLTVVGVSSSPMV
jgi:hypothetical protein